MLVFAQPPVAKTVIQDWANACPPRLAVARYGLNELAAQLSLALVEGSIPSNDRVRAESPDVPRGAVLASSKQRSHSASLAGFP